MYYLNSNKKSMKNFSFTFFLTICAGEFGYPDWFLNFVPALLTLFASSKEGKRFSFKGGNNKLLK